MKSKRELRFCANEIRVAGGEQPTVLQGHAAVFNQMSQDLGGFFELIAPGAFTNTLTSRDVRALFNHDSSVVLGRMGANTLRLAEDDTGLAFEIDTPDTTAGRDLLVSTGRGDINKMSFGFEMVNDKWEKIDGMWVRTLLEVDLFEISPVTFPAYTQTTLAARSLEGWEAAKRSLDLPSEEAAYEHQQRLLRLRLASA